MRRRGAWCAAWLPVLALCCLSPETVRAEAAVIPAAAVREFLAPLLPPEECARMDRAAVREALEVRFGPLWNEYRAGRELLAERRIELTAEKTAERAKHFGLPPPEASQLVWPDGMRLALLADAETRRPELVTPEALEAAYRCNQAAFLVPEHRSLTLLAIERAAPDAEERRADVAARLLQGESFDRLREEFGTADEEKLPAVLQSQAVRRAMEALPPDDANAVSAMVTTPDFYVWGRAKVFPAHYRAMEEVLPDLRLLILRREVHDELCRVLERLPSAPDFEWENETEKRSEGK